MPGSIIWSGLTELKTALAAQSTRMNERGRIFVQQGALVIETRAKQNANTGAHKKGKPRVPGSGPGPNVVTGLLRRSITTNPPVPLGPLRGWYCEVGVATAARYGQWLEAGTSRGMPAYPFFIPAVTDSQPTLAALYQRVMGGH